MFQPFIVFLSKVQLINHELHIFSYREVGDAFVQIFWGVCSGVKNTDMHRTCSLETLIGLDFPS